MTTKLTTLSLAGLLGSLVSLSAIERPDGKKSGEKMPAFPKGGILPEGEVPKAKKPKFAPLGEDAPEAAEQRAYLGVGGDISSPALRAHLNLEGGLLLNTVDPQSPAGLAGLKELDVLVAFDGVKLTDQGSLRAAIAGKKPGDEVNLELIRRGESIKQSVTLGKAPELLQVPPLAIVPNQAADMNRLLNERLGNALGGLGDDQLQKQLMEQLEKALAGGGIDNQFKEFKMGFQGMGSMKLVDGEGSVEMKMVNGKQTIEIRDPEGNVLFEGPYDTEIDKAALPEEYRDRVAPLEQNGKGGAFRFHLNGRDPFNPEKEDPKGE